MKRTFWAALIAAFGLLACTTAGAEPLWFTDIGHEPLEITTFYLRGESIALRNQAVSGTENAADGLLAIECELSFDTRTDASRGDPAPLDPATVQDIWFTTADGRWSSVLPQMVQFAAMGGTLEECTLFTVTLLEPDAQPLHDLRKLTLDGISEVFPPTWYDVPLTMVALPDAALSLSLYEMSSDEPIAQAAFTLPEAGELQRVQLLSADGASTGYSARIELVAVEETATAEGAPEAEPDGTEDEPEADPDGTEGTPSGEDADADPTTAPAETDEPSDETPPAGE